VKEDRLLTPGTQLLGYRIVRPLGAGGMGAVYEAEETTIGRRVAIKALLPELASDERNLQRFEREAKSMSLVRHPAVIDVFAFGKLDDGRPYFVMPLLSGRSLREELSRCGKFTPAAAWAVLREVGLGLAAAHKASVLHRDLKPENIFLAAYDDAVRPVLLDFGIAKWTEDPSDPASAPPANLTATGAPIGTPVYMAPEQWWSQPVDATTDQYAFGIMLYELMAGRPPFLSSKYPELLSLHLHAPPPPLSEHGVVVSEAVTTFLEKLVAKSGEQRFADMAMVVAEGDRAFGFATGGGVNSLRADALVSEPRSGLRAEASEVGTARTELATSTDSAPQPTWRVPLLVVLLWLGLFWLVGYAGTERHAVHHWMTMAGFGGPLSVLLFVIALISLIALGARARGSSRITLALFALSLLPALGASISTFTGWQRVVSVVESSDAGVGFQILHLGRYELASGDFLGLGLSSALFGGLLTYQTRAARRLAPTTSSTIIGENRRAAWALRGLGIAMFSSALALTLASAHSASFLLCVAGLVMFAFAELTGSLDREACLASGLGAVMAARGTAIGRADAHAASAWPEFAQTRAERVEAIVRADLDRAVTVSASWVVLAAVALVLIWLFLRPSPNPNPHRLQHISLQILVLVLCLLPQFLVERAFQDRRNQLSNSLREQFTLFAKLEPPSTQDATLPPPAIAPAVQVTLERVAVNGQEVGRVAALDSAAGRQAIAAAIIQILAKSKPAQDPSSRVVDLSCTFDHALTWSRIAEILSIAHDGGARDVDLLFTRGEAVNLPAYAPPEAGFLIPGDFAAVPVSLGNDGFKPDASSTFEQATQALLERAKKATPVRVAVDSGAR
jgi:hypothetical protein